MARNQSRCVLCGGETTLFSQKTVYLYGGDRTFCSACEKEFRRASGPEKDRLIRRILASPGLEAPAKARQLYDAEQARAREEEERRQAEALMLRERPARQREVLRCCGREMEAQGTFTFQLGEHTFFLGDLSHLLEGSLELASYRCPCCGQIKFFDPGFFK